MPIPPLYQTPGTNFHDVNLDWIINQVKNCIAEWTATKADWTATQEAWTELQEYVQNYFANLDVNQEISDKIDAMAIDGSLLAVIQATVNATTALAAGDWLADHVSQETGYVLDDSMMIANAAADSAAVGWAIKDITPYAIEHPTVYVGRFVTNKWYNTVNGRSIIFPVRKGKTYTITAYGGNRFNAYGFTEWPYVATGSYGTVTGTALNAFDPAIALPYTSLSWQYENSDYAFIGIEIGYSTQDPFAYNVSADVSESAPAGYFTVNGVQVLRPEDFGVARFAGKKVSILGDSISAWREDIPSGNGAYYTGSNSGVSSSAQMWYNIVAANLGMTVLVNNSWSGSMVTKNGGTGGSVIAASDPTRCQALHTEDAETHEMTAAPDIVLVAMGVNDWSNNQSIEAWNGARDIVDGETFEQSYIAMLSRIHYSYPSAKIYCIGPWFSQRKTLRSVTKDGETVPCVYVHGASTVAAGGWKTRGTYADIIKKVCTMCDATFIDGNVGFNVQNFHPTYCDDGSTNDQWTHPNAAGHAVMAAVITERLKLTT